MPSADPRSLEQVREGGKLALARCLQLIERQPLDPRAPRLLDQAFQASRAHLIGLTGPPGVGKSTLMGAMIERWRADRRRVAVIAVDPSSRRTKGALLGDRTRLETDPDDEGVFVRSLAARGQLGGLTALAFPVATLLSALFDVVVVETVGVGQNETAIRDLADTVLLAIQPGAGDGLQFMKSGIIEVPDITIVTKADMRELAARTVREARGALDLVRAPEPDWHPPVLAVSATAGGGLDELMDAVDRHARTLDARAPSRERRIARGHRWLAESVRELAGARALELVGDELIDAGPRDDTPFTRAADLLGELEVARRRRGDAAPSGSARSALHEG